eukprot:gene12658-26656_t
MSRNQTKKVQFTTAEKLEHIIVVNGLLKKFAEDKDFQDDLKLPVVQKALLHWKNIVRLPVDEAEALFENQAVLSVLQNIKHIQHACKVGEFPDGLPFTHMIDGIPELPETYIRLYLGTEFKQYELQKRKDKGLTTEIDEIGPKSVFETIATWGKENSRDPNFSIYKCFIRSIIDTLIFIIGLYITLQLYNRWQGTQGILPDSTITSDNSIFHQTPIPDVDNNIDAEF